MAKGETYICRRGHEASGVSPSSGKRYCQTCMSEHQRRRRAAQTVGESYDGRATPLDRFMRQVEIDVASGCWLWQGHISRWGYGRFRGEGGRQVSAHRFAYRAHVAPIPDGLQIDHLCRVRNCVNPAHLEPVTPRENTMRGQAVTAANAKKVTCRRGHALPEPVNGRRDCKECKRIRGEERRADPARRAHDREYQRQYFQDHKGSAA